MSSHRTKKVPTSYASLRRECLAAVKNWPGCETISGIQIIRDNKRGFSVKITLYGVAEPKLADRAIKAVEREIRRHFELTE
jgi:hypothetical protein